MDNNTLLTLVCILIAVIALLVSISIFFIYRLEEKNAYLRHVIDVLLPTIKKLKVQDDNSMKHHIITCLTMLFTLVSCTHKQQSRDPFDLTGAWVLRHVEFPSGTKQDYALDGEGTSCLIYDRENRLCVAFTTTSPKSTSRSEAPSKPSAALLTGQERIATRPAWLLIEQERLAGGATEKQIDYEHTTLIRTL